MYGSITWFLVVLVTRKILTFLKYLLPVDRIAQPYAEQYVFGLPFYIIQQTANIKRQEDSPFQNTLKTRLTHKFFPDNACLSNYRHQYNSFGTLDYWVQRTLNNA